MKRIIFFAFSLLLVVFTCGCDGEQSYILFNKQTITPQTIASQTSNINVFKPGERVHYLITLPKSVETKMLLIQVVKIGGGKDERLGYELVWSKRAKLRDEQIHYYTDYVVFNQTGAYTMKVYTRDNPTKILTTGDFYIKD